MKASNQPRPFLIAILLAGAAVSCVPAASQHRVDEAALFHDVETLSSDAYQGREAGSEGGLMAREYLAARFEEIGLYPCGSSLVQPFTFGTRGGEEVLAANLVGLIPGTENVNRYIVVSAHFDHVGVRNGEVYNGADDNASGAAALVAVAEHFLARPPGHSVVIAALDAEEKGLRGARAFIDAPCVPLDEIALNVNMDMISRSEAGELYAAGTHHHPELMPVLEDLEESDDLRLLFGHDLPGSGRDDWTNASDHGIFHQEGIPFIYFGVEDHEGYHRPTDDFAFITADFYVEAVELIIDAVERFDRRLDDVFELRAN